MRDKRSKPRAQRLRIEDKGGPLRLTTLLRNFYKTGMLIFSLDFPRDSAVKNPPATQETVSIPRSGRSPGGGNGNPLQYSCLGNPTDRGAWWATVTNIILLSHKRVGHNLVTKLQHENIQFTWHEMSLTLQLSSQVC